MTTTERKHWIIYFACILTAIIVMTIASRAGDIATVWDESVGTVPSARKAKVEAARSLADWLLLDNGMSGNQGVVTFRLKPAKLGASGSLAQTTTAHYVFNSRGKLVLDGQYPVLIELNLDGGLNTWWSDLYLQCIVLHEILHGCGIDSAPYYIHRYVGGTLLQPDDRYTGPALATYRAEYLLPDAPWIPMDYNHLSEAVGASELMTPGLSVSGINNVYLSATTMQIIADNGWNVNPNFNGGIVRDIMPTRRLRDEDSLEITTP